MQSPAPESAQPPHTHAYNHNIFHVYYAGEQTADDAGQHSKQTLYNHLQRTGVSSE